LSTNAFVYKTKNSPLFQHPKLKGGKKTLSLRWTAEKQIFKKNCSGGIADLAGGNGRISMYVVLSLVFIYYHFLFGF
jgi:hypothetical protein